MTREELLAIGVSDDIVEKVIEIHTKSTLQAVQQAENVLKAQQANIDFNTELERVVNSYKPHNIKAVTALLDIDTLKTGSNYKEDVVAALEQLKISDSYLFACSTPAPPYAAGTGTASVYNWGGTKDDTSFLSGLNKTNM